MTNFEPFDEEYKFDKNILTEEFPQYMMDSVVVWMYTMLKNRRMILHGGKLAPTFLLPYNRVLRTNLNPHWAIVVTNLKTDPKLTRNFLSYFLQILANEAEGKALEIILSETSSAYTVESRVEQVDLVPSGALKTNATKMTLAYRVAPIVKKQSEAIISTNGLLAEAWEAHYGIPPDDEKTVTRCTDAIAGLLRDKYFPDEKRPQLGTLIGKIAKSPEDYPFTASSIYKTKELLSLMSEFSKIRGNHKTGTGRTPTHEEASFVLHYSIMIFQILHS